jgi:hypothetical protein
MSRLVAFFLLFLVSSQISAVEWQRLSFDEMVKRSDLVFVGKATRVEGTAFFAYADVRVFTPLKGDRTLTSVRVAIRAGIAEGDPDCCKKRKSYVFFLVKGDDGTYHSANGPFGVVELK